MIRVAVPLEMCWHAVPGGTAGAALHATRALDALDDVEVVGVAARHRRPPDPVWQPSVPVRHLPVPRRLLYETWHSLRWPHVEDAVGPVDLLHTMGGAVAAADRAPLIATVHDLAFVHHPDLFTRNGRRFFKRGLDLVHAEARLVLCSSQATLDDFRSIGFDEARLRHVPLAHDVSRPTEQTVQAARIAYGLDGPYVVVVGTLEPRKNLKGLLDAWRLLDRSEITLAVVGPSGWGDALGGESIPDNVRLVGFVPDEVRDAIYAGAVASCYPSLFEGFGLPVLESMALGCPVVTSTGTSTEELVVDGAGIAVDPRDPRAIADALARLIDDDGERQRFRTAGLARAERYSWERTAEQTVACYREVLDR